MEKNMLVKTKASFCDGFLPSWLCVHNALLPPNTGNSLSAGQKWAEVHRKTLKQDRNSIIGEIVDTTYPYVRKTQRKTRNERSRKLWVLPGAVSSWYKKASWSQPIRAQYLNGSRPITVEDSILSWAGLIVLIVSPQTRNYQLSQLTGL